MAQSRSNDGTYDIMERDIEANRGRYVVIGNDSKSISACAPNADDEICLNNEVLPVYMPLSAKKKDNRLFPDYLLYCEGLSRPVLRGVLHLVLSIILPFGLVHLYHEANGNIKGQIAATLYIVTNIFCYGCSGLYHVGRWSVQTEILLHKLDHCGIAILSTGTMVPLCVLLLPYNVGALFLTISLSLSLWTCYNIFQLRPSVLRQILVPAAILPFLPYCYFYMNYIEWRCTLGCMFFQVCGVIVFTNQLCDISPKIFGYHEVFHLLVVCAGVCVYLANFSIIRRTCNHYTRYNDILELIYVAFQNIFNES